MSGVIDSLVVALGLDASGFKKGAKETSTALKKTQDEAARTAKELEARGKQAAQFFGQIKNQVIGLFAVFTAGKGLSSFVSDVVAGDAAVGRLAKNVGMSVDSLSAWQGVAERAGGSASGISSSIKNLSSQMQKLALTGQSDIIPFLTAAHVNLSKFFDATTPMSEKLLELSDAFKGMDPAKAQALGAGMGLDEGTINVLMQGRGAVSALLAEQEKIGVTNAQDAESAQKLQSAWRALGQASEDLGRKILTSLSPYIQTLGDALLKVSEWAATHRPMVEAMFIGLAAVVTTFAIALAAPLAGIAALAGGIGIAVAAIAVLYDDWKAWVDGGQSAFGGFWQFFADKWASISGTVLPIFASLKAVFMDWVTSVADLLKFVYTLFFGNADEIRQAWGAVVGDLGKYFTDFVGLIKKLGPVIGDALKAAFSAAFDWVQGRAKAVWDAITGKKSSTSTASPSTPAAPAAPSANQTQSVAAQIGNSIADSALGALISKGEGNYNSVNRGAKGGYKAGTENLEGMTVAEVMAAQKKGDFNAAGKYQIIASTLADAAKTMGLKGNEKFDKGMQDKIFSQYLVQNKRKEIGDYVNGKSNDIGAAIKAASKEWASVADPDTGKSHYAGVGNNKASISVEQMTAALQNARSNLLSGAGAKLASNGTPGQASTSTTDVKIGQITVQTQATDAKSIAKEMGPAIKQYAFVAQANTGLS